MSAAEKIAAVAVFIGVWTWAGWMIARPPWER
jgi:hypothetical protein